MKVEIISHTNNAEKYITAAAKLCYSKSSIDDIVENIDDKTTKYYVDMLTDMGHDSVLEHASYTFAVEGVSRSLLAQITRHRIASFSVQSQRYVSMSDFKYIIPPAIANNPDALAKFTQAVEEDKKHYDNLAAILAKEHFIRICKEKNIHGGDEAAIIAEYELLNNKDATNNKDINKNAKEILRQALSLANEDARFILPNACETKFIVTMNARSLLNFFRLRTCQRAQWEIRNLACEMIKKVKEVSPLLFKKAGPPCVCYGACAEGKMSCGKAVEMREKFGATENN